MLEKSTASKQLLFDTSNENEIYNNSLTIELEKEVVTFRFNELIGLEETELNNRDLEIILSSSEGRIKKGLITYKNEDGLKIYCLDTPSNLFLFSIGEFQPCRYKMILECSFRKTNSI
jgi:hypothetical protein